MSEVKAPGVEVPSTEGRVNRSQLNALQWVLDNTEGPHREFMLEMLAIRWRAEAMNDDSGDALEYVKNLTESHDCGTPMGDGCYVCSKTVIS